MDIFYFGNTKWLHVNTEKRSAHYIMELIKEAVESVNTKRILRLADADIEMIEKVYRNRGFIFIERKHV